MRPKQSILSDQKKLKECMNAQRRDLLSHHLNHNVPKPSLSTNIFSILFGLYSNDYAMAVKRDCGFEMSDNDKICCLENDWLEDETLHHLCAMHLINQITLYDVECYLNSVTSPAPSTATVEPTVPPMYAIANDIVESASTEITVPEVSLQVLTELASMVEIATALSKKMKGNFGSTFVNKKFPEASMLKLKSEALKDYLLTNR